jgi:predicted nucleic-acid-binding Zn-ribbon protein
MSDTPIFDYTCSHCGAKETYTLVPANRDKAAEAPARPAPEFDFTCSRCGTTETFQLVKAPAAA